jgi:hypothetical protein
MRFRAILLAVMLLSCTDKKSVPNDIIPKQRMEKIIWEMIEADKFISQYLKKDSAIKNIKLESLKLYDKVFQVNGISKLEFEKSFRYYLNRPDLLKSLFDSLAVKSNMRREEIYRSRK